jgi:hypothetical protein
MQFASLEQTILLWEKSQNQFKLISIISIAVIVGIMRDYLLAVIKYGVVKIPF